MKIGDFKFKKSLLRNVNEAYIKKLNNNTARLILKYNDDSSIQFDIEFINKIDLEKQVKKLAKKILNIKHITTVSWSLY